MGSVAWFKTEENPNGDRNIEDSKFGLDYLIDKVENKTIIDLGCAEGLISHWLLTEGNAKLVHGYEVSRFRVNYAKKLFSNFDEEKYYFESKNIDYLTEDNLKYKKYDVVIALAIIQKLKHQTRFLKMITSIADEYLVLRIPEKTSIELKIPNAITNEFDVVVHKQGFNNDQTSVGPLWIFKRK